MISVIIPTYKEPDVLDLCLRSAIEGQQNKNQIMVVVDGFYDINKEVLEKWAEHIDVLNLEQNVGLCRGTNLGVYNAKHDKILIVNDDNVFPRFWDTTLEEEWRSLSRRFDHENIVISPNQIEPYPSMFKQFIIEDLGTTPKIFDLEKFWLFDYHYASGDKKEECGSTLPIFMNKYDYIRLGGWDENFELGMVADWDFFLKCSMSNLKMIRTWNCHFYHFASISINGEKRRQAEQTGHEYAKYKWGSYIHHNPDTNQKFIL
jgi:glycosyltransferase involved in cell wall biosynthesis